MNTRHKWYNEIIAFAEGKQIQWRHIKLNQKEWLNDPDPYFNSDSVEFRVKPEPVVIKYRRFILKIFNKYEIRIISESNETAIEESSYFIRWIDTEWQTAEI